MRKITYAPVTSADTRRSFGYAWAFLSALLVLIAGIGLAGSLVHSRYEAQENRASAARIAVATVALAAALTGAAVVIQRLRGTHGRLGLGAALALTCAAILLLLTLVLVDLLSGPL